jgi:hypothetical protein
MIVASVLLLYNTPTITFVTSKGTPDKEVSANITHRITGFSDFVHRPDSK